MQFNKISKNYSWKKIFSFLLIVFGLTSLLGKYFIRTKLGLTFKKECFVSAMFQ
jgi:hypothetical protein